MSRRVQIAALGDSITWGFPGGPATSWVARVAGVLSLDIINLGVNGDTLQTMRARLGQVLALEPAATIVMGGTNDVSLGRTAPEMARELTEIIEGLANAGVDPIIGMPIPYLEARAEKELASFRHFINALAGTRKVRVIHFDRVFRSTSAGAAHAGAPSAPAPIIARYYLDTTHPSPEGYAAMAEHVIASGVLAGYGKAAGA